MKKIAPSLLSANFANLGAEIAAVEKGGADWIHIDVMDGHFVPNLTMGPPVIASIRKTTQLPLDVHLMIENPERTIGEYRKAGADWISIHSESTHHLQRALTMIKACGARPSVAINPSTPLTVLDHVWDDIDMVLLMAVNPGFGGQSFIPSMIQKIMTLKKTIEHIKPSVLIEVDGGVNLENISSLSKAGVDIFVAGNAIFSTQDYAKTMLSMKQKIV